MKLFWFLHGVFGLLIGLMLLEIYTSFSTDLITYLYIYTVGVLIVMISECRDAWRFNNTRTLKRDIGISLIFPVGLAFLWLVACAASLLSWAIGDEANFDGDI